MRHSPTIRRVADRNYVIDKQDVGRLRQYFDSLGLRHFSARPGSLFLHRWIYDGDYGQRTVITLFPSYIITCLGPHVPALDELAVESEVQR